MAIGRFGVGWPGHWAKATWVAKAMAVGRWRMRSISRAVERGEPRHWNAAKAVRQAAHAARAADRIGDDRRRRAIDRNLEGRDQPASAVPGGAPLTAGSAPGSDGTSLLAVGLQALPVMSRAPRENAKYCHAQPIITASRLR